MKAGAVVALLVAAFVVGLCVRSYGVPGRTANGGVVVSTPWWNGGVELWGHPGLFDCRDTGC